MSAAEIALALPGGLLIVATALMLLGVPFGIDPLWYVEPLTLSEAVSLRDNGEVVRLIQAGDDPNRRGTVRAELLRNDAQVVTPLEAAVGIDRPDMIETLLENGATLGNESFVGTKNFGTALATYVGNPAVAPGCAGQNPYLATQRLENGRADNVALRYAGTDHAFTYEAMVRIDFDPAANFGPEGWGKGRSSFMQIISADADENADRVFQFRLAPIGTLNNTVA